MKLKGRTETGWAIFNHSGSPWSVRIFPARMEAERYLAEARAEFAKEGWGTLDKHTVQRVRVVISPDPEPKGDTA